MTSCVSSFVRQRHVTLWLTTDTYYHSPLTTPSDIFDCPYSSSKYLTEDPIHFGLKSGNSTPDLLLVPTPRQRSFLHHRHVSEFPSLWYNVSLDFNQDRPTLNLNPCHCPQLFLGNFKISSSYYISLNVKHFEKMKYFTFYPLSDNDKKSEYQTNNLGTILSISSVLCL